MSSLRARGVGVGVGIWGGVGCPNTFTWALWFADILSSLLVSPFNPCRFLSRSLLERSSCGSPREPLHAALAPHNTLCTFPAGFSGLAAAAGDHLGLFVLFLWFCLLGQDQVLGFTEFCLLSFCFAQFRSSVFSFTAYFSGTARGLPGSAVGAEGPMGGAGLA